MMPSWKQFLTEGALTNYRNEREGRKLTYNDFKNTFELVLCKLIEERIPFWFDCQGTIDSELKGITKLGYLMIRRPHRCGSGLRGSDLCKPRPRKEEAGGADRKPQRHPHHRGGRAKGRRHPAIRAGQGGLTGKGKLLFRIDN